MKISRKIIVLAVLGVVALGGVAWWAKDHYAADPLAGLLIVDAATGDIERAALATGTLRPAKLVAVGTQASGRVTAMKVKIGQTVKAGDLIAEIDDVSQRNALKTAQASLDAVHAQLEEKRASLVYAEAALSREVITVARQATSRDAFESARATVATTRAQIAALKAQIVGADVAVETANVNLDYTRITAPLDGMVLLVVTQEGQTVNALQSAPTIAIIGQVDTMAVRAEISEADIIGVKPGQPVYFTILGDLETRWDATLVSLDPAPDSIRSDTSIVSSTGSSSTSSTSAAIYYYGNFQVPNPDGRLKTYMTAQVRVVLGSAKGVVTIPISALSAADAKGERTVEVVDARSAVTRRTVTTGLDDKISVEIRTGLTVGERVVSNRKSSVGTKTASAASPMGL